MKNDSKALRNIVLISQLAICVMVPTFYVWHLEYGLIKGLEHGLRFHCFYWDGTGARNAYVLAMDTIRQEKLKKDKAQQDEIDRKVEEYRKRQEKDSSEIKR